ncbi:MAG: class I tRNA ligase family protein, partial [Patescibacteria group bacterium]|nr:class I tRNA ligase family protein [Patescibacteria group bacterium]
FIYYNTLPLTSDYIVSKYYTNNMYTGKTHTGLLSVLMKELIEAQIIMLSPFTPHLCEEIWESIGNEGLVSTQEWPLAKEELIDNIADAQEELVNTVLDDMRQVMKLAKIENPKNTSLIIYESWKFDLYNLLSETMKETRNPKEIIGAIMRTDLKKKGQQVTKIIPKVIKSGTPKIILSQLEEMQALEEAKNFFMHESNTNIKIVKAETISDNPKSGQASPGKPAIIVD